MIIIALPFPGLGFALWQFWPRRRLTPDVLSYVIIRASCSDVFPRHSPNGPCEHRLDGLLMRSSCRCPRQHCFKKFKDFDMRKKLSRFLSVFWAMRKGLQDAYVNGSVNNCNCDYFGVGRFSSMPYYRLYCVDALRT